MNHGASEMSRKPNTKNNQNSAIVELPTYDPELPVAINVQFTKEKDIYTLELFMWIKHHFRMTAREVMVSSIRLLYDLIQHKQTDPDGELMYIPSNKISSVTRLLNS